MRNKLTDLNNHLFEELERLNDEELTGEALNDEIKRASSISVISNQIVEIAKVELGACKYLFDSGGLTERNNLPPMLIYEKKD